MALAISVSGQASVLKRDPVSVMATTVQIADTAFTTTKTNTTSANLVVACTRFRAVVYLKTLVLGANTTVEDGPIFFLQAADDTGFTTNLTVIGSQVMVDNIASATSVKCFELTGIVPTAARQFARVVCDPTLMGAGSSGTFDCIIEGTP